MVSDTVDDVKFIIISMMLLSVLVVDILHAPGDFHLVYIFV
jgi:hypothetical protein